MPLLRLQLPCAPRRHRRSQVPHRLSHRAFAFRLACAGAARVEHLLRRGNAVADAVRERRRNHRRHRRALAHRIRCGDHARSQSHERRGRELRGLPRRRRQSPVARGSGARRSEPEGARPHAHSRRGARRAFARQASFRARVLRPDLCARGSDGSAVARGTPPRSRSRSRPSLALSAHHRGGDAVCRTPCSRLAAYSRRGACRRALFAHPGAVRGGGIAGLRNLEPRAAGL